MQRGLCPLRTHDEREYSSLALAQNSYGSINYVKNFLKDLEQSLQDLFHTLNDKQTTLLNTVHVYIKKLSTQITE